jgi:hypothetical protein
VIGNERHDTHLSRFYPRAFRLVIAELLQKKIDGLGGPAIRRTSMMAPSSDDVMLDPAR